MYFNLFTPFIVADPGGAGPRLVTPSCLDGRHPHESRYWGRGLAIMLVWEEDSVLWCKRGVKQSANQSFELVQTPSLRPCANHGDGDFQSQDRSSIDLIARVCPPSPDLGPGQLASVFMEMSRAPGVCQTCHQLTCKKYQLRNTFNISNFQRSHFIQLSFSSFHVR